VFFPGNLNAHLFDQHGVERSVVELESVDPLKAVELNRTIKASSAATRIAIHLPDERGVNLGSLVRLKLQNRRRTRRMRSAIHITVIFSCLLAWVMIRPRLYPALSIYIPTTCWLSRWRKLALVQRRLLRPQVQ